MNKETLNKVLTGFLLVLLLLSIICTIYIIKNPKQSEYFSEFYILGKNKMAYSYPTNLYVNETGYLTIGIVNHEGKETTYIGETWLFSKNGSLEPLLLDTYSINLETVPLIVEGSFEPQYEKEYNFSINNSGNYEMWFFLFKKDIDCRLLDFEFLEKLGYAKNNTILSLKLNVEVLSWD